MNKQHILLEIKRTAEANGGVPLGKYRFFQETGIREADWSGKIWARWSDAVREAGYKPNKLQIAFEEEIVLDRYVAFALELGRLPVTSEIRLRKRSDPLLPNVKCSADALRH